MLKEGNDELKKYLIILFFINIRKYIVHIERYVETEENVLIIIIY